MLAQDFFSLPPQAEEARSEEREARRLKKEGNEGSTWIFSILFSLLAPHSSLLLRGLIPRFYLILDSSDSEFWIPSAFRP